jgi:O-antigen ligase
LLAFLYYPSTLLTASLQHPFKTRLATFLVAALIALMPINLLTNLGQASGVFYTLGVVCLTICVFRVGGLGTTLADLKEYRVLALALFFSVLVIAIAALRTDMRLDTEFERALRVSLGTLVILGACLALIPQWLRQATWGLVAATWVAAGYAVWLSWPSFKRPENVPQFNAVSYGDLLLLMTVLATFSVGWRLTRFRKTEIALKVLTMVTGLLGFMTTQTRGGWLAVPFFIVIGLVLASGKASPRKLLLPALIAMLIATAVFASSSIMRQRFEDTITQTAECFKNPLAISSECGRIQLWHVSWLMFKADPLFGSGSTQSFRPMVEEYWRQGIVSDFTHAQRFGEPHSDIMYSLASHGLMGLAALLLMYLAPAWIFARRLSAKVAAPARVAAAMGLVVCVGLFAFGWTELILRTLRTLSFYSLSIAWLLALSDERFLKRS